MAATTGHTGRRSSLVAGWMGRRRRGGGERGMRRCPTGRASGAAGRRPPPCRPIAPGWPNPPSLCPVLYVSPPRRPPGEVHRAGRGEAGQRVARDGEGNGHACGAIRGPAQVLRSARGPARAAMSGRGRRRRAGRAVPCSARIPARAAAGVRRSEQRRHAGRLPGGEEQSGWRRAGGGCGRCASACADQSGTKRLEEGGRRRPGGECGALPHFPAPARAAAGALGRRPS